MQRLLTKNPHDTNIDLVFLLYWGVLVFWQNVNPRSTGTLADTLIKICLFLLLGVYYLLHTSAFSAKAFALVVIFGANMAISFLSETAVTLRNILTYFFPVVFAFFSCCTGARFQINRKKFLRFLWGIVMIVLYAAVYAVVVYPDQFSKALFVTNAYGNELSSFFISNHEYGMYLMAGITACILLLELDPKRKGGKTLLLVGSMLLFSVNLVLTYSRTSMLATALIVLAYTLLNRKSKGARTFFVLLLIVAVAVAAVPLLREYFVKIVLKDNNLAGRDDLATLAIETFKEGSLREKIWGQGATKMADFFYEEAEHASVHNAYFQTMLYFGIAALGAMVLFLVSQLVANTKLIKENRVLGVLFTGLTLACASTMFTNTAVLFSSPIDSFFLTMFTILVPRYVTNAILAGSFDGEV